MDITEGTDAGFLYERIAHIVEQQILSNTLRAGDKLPSLRSICREYGVSQSTALKVYYYLESKLLIEAKPQSGYYVRHIAIQFPALPNMSVPDTEASEPDSEYLVGKVYDNLGEAEGLPLSLAIPDNSLLPIAKLNREVMLTMRGLQDSGVGYDKMEGNERLRRQIARWSFAMGCPIAYTDVLTTSGCLNAVSCCLMALTEKGDTVAMESPVSFGMLQLARSLGLKVLELPTHPQTGIDLCAFEDALKKEKIKIALLISNFSNPLGSCMPDEHKKEVVRLIEQYQIPLIENDINGDIYFGEHRPKSCKTYDQNGLVLWCGSVSKTLAPGYRVGWVAPGKFKEKVLRIKSYHAISSTTITQEVIARFLETGRYESHLRKLRQVLHANYLKYAEALVEYFPEGTKATRPGGGSVIWVELPKPIHTVALYEKAIKRKISFAPGKIFTLQKQFDNCMRLNYGLQWNQQLKENLRWLGQLAKAELRE